MDGNGHIENYLSPMDTSLSNNDEMDNDKMGFLTDSSQNLNLKTTLSYESYAIL
jgi:hypothetical protein